MTAVDLDLTADRLADSGPPTGKVDDIFTDLPDDLPPIVDDLAVQVTQDAKTPYEKAVALQNWFREDGGFTYALERASGNGSDALVEFLSDGPGGRTGYCEQFASAMAVMARELEIPARVAVGFLQPRTGRPGRLGLQQPRHARLAGALLRRCRVGALRADPGRAGRGRARRTPSPARATTTSPAPPRPPRRARRRSPRRAGRRTASPARLPATTRPVAAPASRGDRRSAASAALILVAGGAAAPPRPPGATPRASALRRAVPSRSGPSCATPPSTSAFRGRATARRG